MTYELVFGTSDGARPGGPAAEATKEPLQAQNGSSGTVAFAWAIISHIGLVLTQLMTCGSAFRFYGAMIDLINGV
ncbi:hypothetical protein J3P80_09000 [Pseudomonas sp. D2-30]|uniref:hypothetical protein n=1 Tax=unclassified Pseudomonas TaxID=196821 RepID=UPI003DA93511